MKRLALCLSVLLALTAPAEQAQSFELNAPTPLIETAKGAEFLDFNDKLVTLNDYKGQVLVVNFWATWCAPCRREMPSVGRLQAEFADRELIVLAIAVDRASIDKIDQFMAEVGVDNLTILRDTTMASMKNFQLRGLPATIVLDTQGQQVGRHEGFDEWDRPEIIEALETLLAEAS